MLMKNLGYMPKRGEVVTIDHYMFKILSADSRRIKHVQLTLLPVTQNK